jgi:hypothetical protein
MLREIMNTFIRVLEGLWCALKCEDEGSVFLCAGQHEIKVDTCCRPEKIFLSVNEVDGCCMAVCNGDINTVGSTILDDGFILYADVKTTACTVEWVIEY